MGIGYRIDQSPGLTLVACDGAITGEVAELRREIRAQE
jgi:hypothetical protein